MKIAFSILFYCCSLTCFSQIQIDSLQSIKLDEILVNPLRNVQPKRKIAQQIESLSKKEIEFQNMPTSADVLANTGKLSIQKSQQGGGSPVIRGFEASRILLLVDGVRMNNLIYRAGHLQNSITVDKNILEKIDVLFGPSSTIFGSDALGGAIYLQTKAAKLLSQIENKKWSGNVMSNYSTVNEGKSAHVDLNFASQQWASLSSVSFNEFGDLKMGKKRNGSNDFFGERPFYVETINGVDQQVANDNKYVQKFSGYKQYDFMQKVVYQPNSNVTHSLNFQYSTTSDIPRYDRLTDLSSNGNLRSAVWKYGPQKRFLSIYKITKDQVFKNTKMNLNVSYQNVEESRINRNFGSSKLNSRIEKVSVIALSSDFTTKINQGNLTYGVDIYRDGLQSTAFQENILTGVETDLDTRYPDGNNTDLPNVAIEDLEINYGSNTIKAATWGRGLWEYSLANRNTFPAIVKTSITNPQSFSMPKASFAQYVTSEIQYTGTLTDVHVSWAINTPAFNATNVIPMSLVSGTTWKSNTPLPDFPVGTKVFFKVFATGSNSDTSETYKFMYDLKVNEFCTASGENTSGALSMTSFSCANLTNNPTVYNAYTNYTTTPIVMHKGSMYTATGVFNQSWTDNDFIVWIDYNNNNEFELSERVVLDINTGNSGTGSFTIPNDAYEGNVRMRVRLGYWGDYTEACGTTLGEVEDYLVTIYPPKPAIIFSGNATACLSDSNELTYTGTPVDSISWVLSNGINTYNFTGNTVNTTTFAIGSYSITINVVKYGLPFSAVFANYLTIANPPTNVDIINADENVACGTIKMITASGGAVTENSITINSGVLNLALPDNSAVGVSKILNVSGLPSSAIITKVNVGFNINHEWLKDVEVVLKAPNGKYIALAADQGPNAVGAYVNTLITSDNSAAALSTLATPITGTYKANATIASGLKGSFGTNLTSTFSDLFTVVNGDWTVLAYDDGANDLGTLIDCFVTITYTIPNAITWSATNATLYTDAAGLIAYSSPGNYPTTIYAKPVAPTAVITATAAFGSCIKSDAVTFSVSNCSSNLTLKLFIEGYYDLNLQAMRSVKNNQDGVSNMTDVEDLIIELHETTAPYALVDTTIGTLHTDGTLQATFPSLCNSSYYIVVKGSNIVQTWSALPQTIGTTPLNYDFTTTASKAYGNNMKQVSTGVWAFYSSDLVQDDLIDLTDYSIWEAQYLDFAFGIEPTDLNGDGVVDLTDYSIWEANYLDFNFAVYPF